MLRDFDVKECSNVAFRIGVFPFLSDMLGSFFRYNLKILRASSLVNWTVPWGEGAAAHKSAWPEAVRTDEFYM